MKFLKDEEITKTSEDGKISITVKQLSTSVQGKVLSMSAQKDLASQLSILTFLCLDSIIKIKIDGVEYPPLDVATKSDLKCKDTLTTVMIILGLALDATILSEGDKKKSSPQQLLKEPEKGAKSAQGATEDTPQIGAKNQRQ